MKIVRNFELFGILRPIEIKQDGKTLTKVGLFESTKTIPSNNKPIDISFDCFKSSVNPAGKSTILIRQNRYFSAVVILAWFSMAVSTILWGKNDILDYSLLIFPILYLAMMIYFAFFNRSGFLKIETW